LSLRPKRIPQALPAPVPARQFRQLGLGHRPKTLTHRVKVIELCLALRGLHYRKGLNYLNIEVGDKKLGIRTLQHQYFNRVIGL
jgi:hypothetical protein